LDTMDDGTEALTSPADPFLEAAMKKLAQSRDQGDKPAEVNQLIVVGDRLLKSQKLTEAGEHARNAMSLARDAKDSRLEADVSMLQFRIKLAEEDTEAAEKHAEAVVKRFSSVDTVAEEMYTTLALADICVVQGRFKEAERLAGRCRSQLAELGDHPRWEATAWEAIAHACLSAESHDRALHAAGKARALYADQKDTMMEAAMLRLCSRIHSSKGEHGKAQQQAEVAKSLCVALEDPKSTAACLDMMANAALIKREGWKQAIEFAKESEKLSKSVGDRHSQAAALTTLASAHLTGGSSDEALKAASSALDIVRQGGDVNAISEALETMMNVKPEKSLEWAEEELNLAGKAENPKREVAALKRVAGVHFANDLFEEAIAKAKQARELQKKLGDKAGEAITCSVIADYCLSQKKHQEALEASRAAQALLKECGNVIGQAQALQQEFRVHCGMEDVEAARKAAWDQRLLFQEAKYKEQEAATLLEIADFEAHVGGAAEALKPVELARALYRELEDKEGEADACRAIANIHLADQSAAEALKAAEDAFKLSKDAGDAKGKASALQTKTSILVSQEKYKEAAILATEARQVLQESGHAWTEANAVQMVANVYLAACQKAAEADKDPEASTVKEAQSTAEEAVRLFQGMRDTEGQAAALLVASSAMYYAQDGDRALQLGREALDLYEKFGNSQGMANAWLAMARGAFLAGTNFDGALEAAEEAKRLAEVLGDDQIQTNALSLIDIISDSMRKVAPAQAGQRGQAQR